MSTVLSSALVSTDWLAQRLGDANLRIFDFTANLGFDPDKGITVRAGREEYEDAHIPGAAFLDFYKDLTDQESDLEFMMPAPEKFSQVLSAAGLGNEHQVVLYSNSRTVYWATRLWWMLRACGFTNAAVLDGGLPRWKADGKPTSTGTETYPAATFTAVPDASYWVDKEAVFAEIGNQAVCTINTLSRDQHVGTAEQTAFQQQAYGRQGRNKGSENVPYAGLLTEEGLFAPLDQLKQAFDGIDALDHERIILYCGAGLSSTMGAFALHLLGYDNVAIYDGSLNEWGWDQSMPMETG